MTTKAILAFDLGTTTGWAFARGDYITSSLIRLPKASPARAYCALERGISSLACGGERGIDLIAYEEVPATAHSGGIAAHRWGGYEAILMLVASRIGVPYLGLTPTQWKRAAGLRSATGPREALAAAVSRWPDVSFAAADEAVARWVALAAERKIGGGA